MYVHTEADKQTIILLEYKSYKIRFLINFVSWSPNWLTAGSPTVSDYSAALQSQVLVDRRGTFNNSNNHASKSRNTQASLLELVAN